MGYKKTVSSIILIGMIVGITAALWAGLPKKMSSIARNKIFQCVLHRPYGYMFEPYLPNKPGGNYHPEQMTTFMAGPSGILYYSGLNNCIGGKKASFGSLKAMSEAIGLPATAGKNSWLPVDYHPAIIKWATDNFVPNPKEKLYGHTFQKLYDQSLRRFFRLMAASYKHLKQKKRRLKTATKHYLQLVEKGYNDFWPGLEKRYKGVLPQFRTGTDYSQLQPVGAIAFWIRRHADNTASELWKGNKKVLKLYDTDWYNIMQLDGLK